MGASAVSGIVRFVGLCHNGPGVVGASAAGGTGSQAPLPLFPSYPWPQELLGPGGWNHVYLPPLLLSGSLGLQTQLLWLEGWVLQAPPLLFSCFHLLYVFQSTHL